MALGLYNIESDISAKTKFDLTFKLCRDLHHSVIIVLLPPQKASFCSQVYFSTFHKLHFISNTEMFDIFL